MITLSQFIGEIPTIIPRLLPDGAAQLAKNCKLVNGAIVPLRYSGDYRVLGNGNSFFYKHGTTWFEYSKVVDVVNAPIAKNRLYITGDGVPKIVTDASVIYSLAVKQPPTPLTAVASGVLDVATQSTVVYSYTYVTAYDEESEPAPVSNEVVRSPGMEVTLTGFVAPPTDRNYNRIRIYRSQTSLSGITDLYFIAEVALPVPNPSYVDLPEDSPIQEAIGTLTYNPPPDDLQGIIALPNGMLAGFTGNKLYFSEPYIPHAWPEKYVLTTNYDIVGLGAFGRSIAIMTKGNPYIATGITPDAMAMELIEVNYPCVNKRGIVDLGYAVAYPSSDGLILVSSEGAKHVTRQLFTRDQWQQLNPQTMVACQYDGRYVACYSYVDSAGATQSGTIIIDLTGEQAFLSRTDFYTNYMFYEPGAGKLYVLDGQKAKQWDAPNMPYMQMEWRSKKIVLDGPINMGASMVDIDAVSIAANQPLPMITIDDATFVSESFPSTVVPGSVFTASADPAFQAVVYADGAAVQTFSDINKVSRLPGGFMARTWEVTVKGRQPVTSIYLAWSPSELYVGAK
jgi:hypothetical protein